MATFLLNFPISENTEEAQNETIGVFGKGWAVMTIRRGPLGVPKKAFTWREDMQTGMSKKRYFEGL